METEQRDYAIEGLELRTAGDTGGNWHTFVGHAAVFNELSRPLYHPKIGEFRERIQPGAFRDVLADKPHVDLLYNHDSGAVLASTRAGSLELAEDARGLRVWARLDPEDRDVQRVVPKIRNGTAGQMSFKFVVGQDDLEERGDVVLRSIRSFKLMPEVSVLSQGAYQGTAASIRSFIDQAVDLGRIGEERKDFSAGRREQLAKEGKALPDGSFPIESVQDLKNAIQAIGRAKDPAAAKAHIKKRARALGATELLPDDWRSLDGNVEGLEGRSQTPSGDGLGGPTDTVQEERRREAVARIQARVVLTPKV